MITVNLHGHLKDSFGTGYQFAVNTLADVLKAMDANFATFSSELQKDNRQYNVIVDNTDDYGSEEMVPAPMGTNSIVDIIPAIAGAGSAGGWQIVGGAVLIVAGIFVSVASWGLGAPAIGVPMISMGLGLLIGGIASFFVPDEDEEDAKAENTKFSGPQNLVGQGHPVPLGYGRLRIGSNLISAYFSNSYEILSTARVWWDNVNAQYHIIYSQPGDPSGSAGTFDLTKLWYTDSLEGISMEPIDPGIFGQASYATLSTGEIVVYDPDTRAYEVIYTPIDGII